jgi:hypothetical protein
LRGHDHLIVLGEAHLCGVLKAYASYYNEARTHLSLDKDAPNFRRAQKFGRIAAMPILGGLHHQYVRVQVLDRHRVRNATIVASLPSAHPRVIPDKVFGRHKASRDSLLFIHRAILRSPRMARLDSRRARKAALMTAAV